MSREGFSQTPEQIEKDELSRFVEEAIATYRQEAEAEEQYESPVPVFDEETGHYVYQESSDEGEEEKMPDLTEQEEQEEAPDSFYFETFGTEEQEEGKEQEEPEDPEETEDPEEPEESEESEESEEPEDELTLAQEAEREQQLFREANMPEEAMPSQIPNPLPVPPRRDHVELSYDHEEEVSPEKENYMDAEDDFDIEIDEDDDFDI